MIHLGDRYGERGFEKWIELGASEIRDESNLCCLAARMDYGITDFEHDSAYALRLPLIGLKFVMSYNHTIHFEAYIDPHNEDEFRVPPVNYDPTKHERAYTCEDCEEHHPVVPEGFYVPPFDKELYDKVKGHKVRITIGPNWEKEK